MELSPAINDPVILVDRAGAEYRSRVEDVQARGVTVARPLDLLVGSELGPGDDLLVTWPDPRGIAVLPVRIAEDLQEGQIALWRTEATAKGWVEQRRRYVRVSAVGSVLLVPVLADPGTDPGGEPDPIRGTLVDVSEGGLLCAVPIEIAEAVEIGTETVAGFRLGEIDFEIPGRLAFRRATPMPSAKRHLAVEFTEPVRDGDALRRQIFALQRTPPAR